MSEDITWCYNSKCPHTECERHSSHIKLFYIPHSFAFYERCQYWDMKKTYYYPSKEGCEDGK